MRHPAVIPCASLLVAFGPWSAAAQQPAPLEEIVVTAGLRTVPAGHRPGGASVIARDTVEDAAVVHLEELLPLVPSLSWAGASSRPRYFQLRGIGELEQYQGAPNPSVGFLVDEIDFSGIGMIASTFDVEQVEVLRGPQGTRYGANALGGLIKIKTRDPVPVREFGVEAGAGDDGLWMAGAVAGGGFAVTGGARGAWRAVVHQASSDGFRHNAYLGRDDTNERDELTARLKLRLATARLRADLGLMHADFDNGYDAFAIDNSFRTLSDRPGRDAQRSDGAYLDLAWSGWRGLELRSTGAWAESDIEASFDGDWGNDDDWGDAGPYDFFSQALRTRRTLSQDLRLLSQVDGAWSWLVGAWISRLEEANSIRDDGLFLDDAFERQFDSRYRATSTAVYGQVEWSPLPATVAAAGLRLEERDANYGDSDGLSFRPRERMWGGELSVTQRLGEAQRVWAALSRGFRAGGFNIGTAVPADRAQFGDEYLWSVEIGWKGRDAGNTQSGDVNLFYTRREDQQVATSFQLDPQDPLTFLFLTDNAANGEAWGVEATGRRQLTPALALEAMLSWMDSRFLGYRFGERDLDGRAWAHAPEWKLALAAGWRHPAGWTARLDLSAESGFYFDNSHDQRAGSRFLANARAGFDAGRWSVHVWVRNLFDERYPVRGFYFGNEPPDFPEQLFLRWGDPRQLGVTARFVY
ncbi:MAG TPA: TonB-dependent receptor [Steroidobacteraceae bacterium]|nr:TonB-dependent receptor [Steroidobacteraceae bacterium]